MSTTTQFGSYRTRETLEAAAAAAGVTPEEALAADLALTAQRAAETTVSQTQQLAALAIQSYENGEYTLHELRQMLEGQGQGEAAGLLVAAVADDHRQWGSSEDDSYDQLDPIEYQQTYAQELAADRDRISAELAQARIEKAQKEIGAFGERVADEPDAVKQILRAQLEQHLTSTGTVPDEETQRSMVEQANRSAAAAEQKAAEIDAAAETTARILKNQHAGFGGEFQDSDKREAHIARKRLEAMHRVEFSPQELLPASTPEEERQRTVNRLRETVGAGERFQERAHEIRRAGLEGVDNPLAHIEQSTRDRGAARQRLREVDERAAATVEPSETTKAFIASTERRGEPGAPRHPSAWPDELGPAI